MGGENHPGCGGTFSVQYHVIAVKEGKSVKPLTDAGHMFQREEHLIIAGSKQDSIRLLDKK